MFTGIIKKVCSVHQVNKLDGSMRYSISFSPSIIDGLVIGASVSVDGVCQTVVDIDQNLVTFDAIGETLARTTLKKMSAGSQVNIERALRVGDEVGGHFLSGHIIDTGTILEKTGSSSETFLRIAVDQKWMKYLFEKGFISVDGVSLTLGVVDPAGSFTLHLIPETLRMTTLGSKKRGDPVNIEIDSHTQVIVDTVERIQKKHS